MTRHLAAAITLGAVCAACGGAKPRAEEPPKERPRVAVALRFVEAPPTQEGVPRTEVLLVRIEHETSRRAVTPLGTYDGACAHAAVTGPALMQAQCWWADHAAVILVRRDEDELVVVGRQTQADGAVPPLEELARVALPPHAALDLIVR